MVWLGEGEMLFYQLLQVPVSGEFVSSVTGQH